MPATDEARQLPGLVCEWEGASSGRSRRVLVLLLAIIILSIADLVVTLFYLRTVGMVEANPIAALIIRATQSSWALSLYKLATVGTCVALLYRVRHRVLGECAAWCGLLILVALVVMWHFYSTTFESPEEMMLVQAAQGDGWLRLD